MNNPVMNRLETRIKAIEDRLQILDTDIESLRREISLPDSNDRDRNTSSIASGVSDPSDGNGRLFFSQYDSFMQNDYMRYISLSCFILGAALFLRYTTENNILSSSAGILTGMVYSYSLIGLAFVLPSKYLQLRRVIGILGWFLLHLIIIESCIHFQALGTETVFWFLVLSMIITFGLASRLDTPFIFDIGLSVLPIVLLIVSYFEIRYPEVCLLFLIASFPILFLQPSSVNSFSRVLLGCFVLIILFSWNRDLNFAYHNSRFLSSDRLVYFVFYVTAFSALFLLRSLYCPLREMEPSRSDILLPSFVLLFLYFFARHHSMRSTVSMENLHQVFLFLSLFLITVGIFIGDRIQDIKKSIGYLILPSLCLFLVSSANVIPLWNRLILLWIGLSLPMYILSYRLQNPSLHGIACILQAASLCKILWAFVMSPVDPLPTDLFWILAIVFLIQYWIQQRCAKRGICVLHSLFTDKVTYFFLLGCIAFYSYLAGKSMIEQWSDSLDFNRCLESVVLTFLASLFLLAGERQKKQEISLFGFVIFALAAFKTFVLDPLMGIGEFFAFNVIAFGTILGVDAYVFQRLRRKAL